MSFDANAHRASSLAGWEEAAPGWVRRQDGDPRARCAGIALDARRGLPEARAIGCSSWRPASARRACSRPQLVGSDRWRDHLRPGRRDARGRPRPRRRAGARNVEFRVLGAEWIDLPLASVDAVLCRWGYMLLADPAAALGETRRVLRRGGGSRWRCGTPIQHNPWALLPALELIERGLTAPPAPGTPGPFALGDPERVRELLEQAGFTEIDVQAIDDRAAPPVLRGLLGDHARHLARLPRRGAQPPRAGDRRDPRGARLASCAVHLRRGRARHSRAHARRLRHGIVGRRGPAGRPGRGQASAGLVGALSCAL